MKDDLLTQIFLRFAGISLLAVGGATAALPEAQRQIVGQLHWLTGPQFAETFAIAQTSPGPNVIVFSLFGWRLAGLAGLFAATLGILGPSSLLAFAAARAMRRAGEAPWLAQLKKALIPLAIGLMAANGYLLARGADFRPARRRLSPWPRPPSSRCRRAARSGPWPARRFWRSWQAGWDFCRAAGSSPSAGRPGANATPSLCEGRRPQDGKKETKMSRIAYVNGRYIRHSEAGVSIDDRAFLFADGIYEVIEVFDGALIDEAGHLARLGRSARELRLALPVAEAALKLILRELVARNRVTDGHVYLQVTRGSARRDHAFPPPGTPTTLVAFAHRGDRAAAEAKAQAGIKVISLPDIRWKRPDIKTTSLLPNVLARQQAREAGAYEAWLIDEQGFVTEGSASNAWIVDGEGALVTHPADSAILAGITRARLFKIAAAQGVDWSSALSRSPRRSMRGKPSSAARRRWSCRSWPSTGGKSAPARPGRSRSACARRFMISRPRKRDRDCVNSSGCPKKIFLLSTNA